MGEINSEKKALIERYLLKQLSAEEEIQFANNMEDPAFQQEFEFQKDILEMIDYQGDIQLKALLQEEETSIKKIEKSRSGKLFSLRRISAIAATVLFLVFIGWQFLIPKQSELFANYFVPHTNTLYPVVKSGENKDEVEQVFYLYETREYEKALPGFEKIQAENKNDDIAFYQANALLELGKTPEAIAILQAIVSNNKTNYLAPAKWYLALAYISQQKIKEAKPMLQDLLNNPFYQKRAEKLLQEPAFKKVN